MAVVFVMGHLLRVVWIEVVGAVAASSVVRREVWRRHTRSSIEHVFQIPFGLSLSKP